ncbi:MAG: DUF3604 domain-containing protein [Gammaproteobacteria bacterium]|nr:DUF3604 domain-containing protein [Gammaproteobacteria bacterium]
MRPFTASVLFLACSLASAGESPQRQAYFGDLHIHTRWSFDAYALNVQATPKDAYRYARGGAIEHPAGGTVQLQGPPLDFIALTEHAAYLGVSAAVDDPRSPLREVSLIRDLMSDDPEVSSAALGTFAASLASGEAPPELITDDIVKPTWRRIVELADEHNQPGEFTALVAYEYTSMPDGQNLHRNVIFRGNDVPERPFASVDSLNPEDLWRWMDEARAAGDDLIAIPHNANASNGLMYARTDWSGDPIDAAYADVRMRNEPVSELFQIKGSSETHPMLSPADEWAGFEIFDRVLGRMTDPSEPAGSYVRDALKSGLVMSLAGFNPFEMGVIGSSDGHNATSPVEEDNYTGKIGIADHTPERRLITPLSPALPISAVSAWGAAGLAGVWADANTREALFDALRRRETFATSGPRIRVRLFGGWSFGPADLGEGMVTTGYVRGVPMGGVLPGRGERPTFLVHATRDPVEAQLDRLQMIKLWVEDGKAREAVIDIACAGGDKPVDGRCPKQADNPNEACEAVSGANELDTWWADTDFSSTLPAVYYVRVLQVPTCRWSVYDSRKLGIPHPEGIEPHIQERAVTSAIWYRP